MVVASGWVHFIHLAHAWLTGDYGFFDAIMAVRCRLAQGVFHGFDKAVSFFRGGFYPNARLLILGSFLIPCVCDRVSQVLDSL